MPLRLTFAATLRRYLPGYDGESGYEVSVKPESTVRDLCRKLATPEKEVRLIMIEGIAAYCSSNASLSFWRPASSSGKSSTDMVNPFLEG